ncbi:MAG: acyl-ACP--UDP-N-acetylglucosamine O-acyltransferase [Planctomycetota bacterium]
MIHPTAIVDPGAKLADDVEIGPYCVIGPEVEIGPGSQVMQHVSIVERTTIGARNVIHPGAILGGDPQDKKYHGEETWLHLGDDNQIREMATLHRGTAQGGGVTRVGNGCLIMAACHVAHDCILGDDVTLANNVLLGGHIVVEDHVGIGGMTAVHHFVTVGRYAFVGGATRLNKDAPPFLITEGHPARSRAINRVGLSRRGKSDAVIQWLKEAQRLLFHEGMIREEAYERLEKQGDIPDEGRFLFEFLAESERGKQGRARQP